MKTVIIDTNALLRFILNDIPVQKQAVEKLIQKAKKGQLSLLIPQIIIFELHFILDKYYNVMKEDIITTLHTLVSTKYIQIESRDLFLKALTQYKTSTISFVDCFVYIKAQSEDAELFTFYKKLKNLK